MMRKTALVLAVALVHGCGGGDVVTENISSKPAELVTFEPTVPIKLEWSAQLNFDVKRRGFSLPPVLSEGSVFVTEATGRVAAYRADNGALRWEKVFDEVISSGVGAGSGVVAFALENGELVALSSVDGSQKFRAPLSSELLSAPQISGDKIIVCLNDGRVIAFDATSGQRIWISANNVPALSLRGSGRPVIVGERVIVGFANGHVAAFNLLNGRRLWETTVAVAKGRSEIERLVDVDATPRVVDGVVYAASYQGQIAALAIDTGQTIWTRDASTYVDVAVDQLRVYIADADGQLWALDRKSGAPLWRQEQLHGRKLSGPVRAGDLVAVGDFQGYVHWLKADDGHFVARSNMMDANRRAVVAGAVRLQEEESGLPEPAPIRATPGSDADSLFVRDENGILAAFRSGS